MSDIVRGMPTGLYVSDPALYGQSDTAPAIRISVREYRPRGSTSLPVRLATDQGMSSTTLTVGTVLAVATAIIYVTKTTEVRTGATVPLEVSPLPISLSRDSRLWTELRDLHRVQGTSDTDLEVTVNTQDATSAIGTSTWAVPAVTGRSWRMPRRGRFRPHDAAYRAIRRTALEDDLAVYVRRVLPNENGDPTQVEGGWATITNFRTPAPADGVVDATWVFEGIGPLQGEGSVRPNLDRVMLDFRRSKNIINVGFV